MKTLIFDIETVGEKFDEMDETTKAVLTKWYRENTATEEEYQLEGERLKKRLGFSALHGEIVAIGVMDADSGQGAVYYQAPGAAAQETVEGAVKLVPMSEKEMLEKFWQVVSACQIVVGFNSRMFDVPFINVRSAICGVRPSVDLLSNRYLSLQKGPKHVDLLDQLTFYGASMKKGGLHLWCRAFGIESPKAGGVTGDDVGGLFDAAQYEEIARYNVGDLVATRELYHRWHEFLDFQLSR